jgi:hypothetical protein
MVLYDISYNIYVPVHYVTERAGVSVTSSQIYIYEYVRFIPNEKGAFSYFCTLDFD